MPIKRKEKKRKRGQFPNALLLLFSYGSTVETESKVEILEGGVRGHKSSKARGGLRMLPAFTVRKQKQKNGRDASVSGKLSAAEAVQQSARWMKIKQRRPGKLLRPW